MNKPQSIVFIGMAGAGKSTLGKMLAQATGFHFFDTDAIIESEQKQSLQQLLDQLGYLEMRRREGQWVAAMRFEHPCVIATGGSVVYSDTAMQALKRQARCIYLQLPLTQLRQRLGNLATRGFFRAPGQSLEEVYAERETLYRKYADITLDCAGHSREASLQELLRAIGDRRS